MQYIDETKRAGWDDLYEDCFDGINQIINDNLNLIHNELLIEDIFSKMLNALQKSIIRMQEIPGDKKNKDIWFNKVKNIKEYANQADSPNKKVITINIIDQFLRSTY